MEEFNQQFAEYLKEVVFHGLCKVEPPDDMEILDADVEQDPLRVLLYIQDRDPIEIPINLR